jgi:signal transduction histidine kinase
LSEEETELELLRRERRELIDRLRDLERERAQAAAALPMASHTLLLPVTALRLQLDVLAVRAGERDVPGAWLLEHAGAMRRQVERMEQLLRAAIELWRDRTGAPPAPTEPCDLAAIARAVVAAHADEAGRAAVALTVDAPAALVGPWHAARLRFVAANLVSNALRHGAGTPVTVTVGGDDERAWLRVSDRGPGVAAAEREHVFEPFNRGEGGGFGLGLWIVRELAGSLGGEVAIGDEPDGGARFTVSLPRLTRR